MPVVLRTQGFAFGFYANDHAPPHVHVIYAGTRCRILLETLAVTHGSMKQNDQTRAVQLVAANRETLERAWTAFQLRRMGL
ncbi:MAG TPA: DUF4160 domain-containing protein [Longimicrobium sp.]|nr:DUF4160 domain-containing protein [Longimicrobium sp.]